MNGNEVCVSVVRGRGRRLVSRILPPQLFEFEGEGGFNSRQGLEKSAIGLEGDLCLESSSGLTFSNGLEKGKIFEFFYFYMYTR